MNNRDEFLEKEFDFSKTVKNPYAKMKNNLKEYASDELRTIIIEAIAKATADKKFEEKPLENFIIETPANPKNGDLATNVAFSACKSFKIKPLECARIICEYLNLSGSYFESYEIKSPGFINFFYSGKWYGEVLASVVFLKDDYGRTDKNKGLKYIVEYVSANPTGPMHIGNARGGAVGDVISEVLKRTGADVTREFYLNDAGNQIEKFGKSLSLRYENLFSKGLEFPPDLYQGDDITKLSELFKQKYGDKFVDTAEDEREKAMIEFALPKNIEALKKDMTAYRVEFDNWFKESELYKSKTVYDVIQKLQEANATYEKDGALWFKSTEYGCEKDDVLIRVNKIPTYFAADIAYHYNKLKIRGFDVAINVWGADHHGHVMRLKAAMEALGIEKEKIKIVLMQMVRLIKGGEHVKMSKRKGDAITLGDLLTMVPVDAARFFFNLRQPSSHFDFDLSLAVEKTSQNPVYYVQYAHARICSIIKKLNGAEHFDFNEVNYGVLIKEEEKLLIQKLSAFPNEIITAAKDLDPSRLTKYATDLSTDFHKFYTLNSVKNSEPALLKARLGLCVAVKTVLKNLLSILKVDAKESM